VLSVIALGGAAVLTANGRIGPLVSALGNGFTGAIDRLSATPLPTVAQIVATNSPIISPPASPYTQVATIDLRITIPADVVGSQHAKVRIYVALQGLTAAPILDEPIGSSINMSVPVDLTKGRNDLTATIIRDGVESESSPIVTVILDQDKPKVTIRSPKTGSTVNEPDVTIKGTTEAGTSLVARNDANGSSETTVAAPDGTFTVILPMEPGTNAIRLDATDPAGNKTTVDVSYLQGSGEMGASLSASLYRISVAKPPKSLQLTVLVTDPTGAALAGASAFFTLQIPGLAPISGQVTTGDDGRATFTTPLIGKLATGDGQATVLVTDDVFGETTDRLGLTFIP
jgi:hypothetical protein